MINKKEPSIIETEKILLSVKEVCKLTGLSEKTVRTLVEENHLMVRIGRRTMVDRKKLEKWLVKQS
ncbi:helix-turn-helix domain-containing protein [Blautia sp. MCC289]|nr:helix-turn-helix domain-containing protein [Blautia sp. MCC289]MCC2238334.1 helix-turn-helix domain-containing protein [Fusicatenibacter sp. CLA-AA-H213]